MNIRIMADSTCDLSPDYIEEHQITTLPLTINMDGTDYSDGVDITPDDIFRRVALGSALPKTSAINVEDYHRTFTRALKECDAILHFAISAEFSSCHANAVTASKGLPVYCIDSRNLSGGIGILVAEAVDMIESGCGDPEAVVSHVKSLIDKVDTSFVVNRLDYLHKGGRCSAVAMLGANMLHLKPCIEVVDGRMIVGKKYRGSFDRCLKNYLEDRLQHPDSVLGKRVYIVHTGVNHTTVDVLKQALRDMALFGEIAVIRAGSTISSHCGDNTLGVIFIRK